MQYEKLERPDWMNDGPGKFPWDHWEQKAKAAGVPDDLAGLGRSLYREAYQHGWSDDLQAECGWQDNGDAMIKLALENPNQGYRTLAATSRN